MTGQMRKLSTPNASFLRWKSLIIHTHRLLVAPTPALRQLPQTRSLAQVRSELFSDLWFTPSSPARGPADELLNPSGGPAGDGGDHKPPDERILKLGKSECALQRSNTGGHTSDCLQHFELYLHCFPISSRRLCRRRYSPLRYPCTCFPPRIPICLLSRDEWHIERHYGQHQSRGDVCLLSETSSLPSSRRGLSGLAL
jgi:hypothetical protein